MNPSMIPILSFGSGRSIKILRSNLLKNAGSISQGRFVFAKMKIFDEPPSNPSKRVRSSFLNLLEASCSEIASLFEANPSISSIKIMDGE